MKRAPKIKLLILAPCFISTLIHVHCRQLKNRSIIQKSISRNSRLLDPSFFIFVVWKCKKNTAKCVTFLQIFHIFFAYEFCAFFSVFSREICRILYGNFLYFSSFFVMIFMKLCAGMGKAGSRSNPGVNEAIPIGITLKILVSAARNQRKAKLAPKLVKCR